MIEEEIGDCSEQHRHHEHEADARDHRRHREERDTPHGHAGRPCGEHGDRDRCASGGRGRWPSGRAPQERRSTMSESSPRPPPLLTRAMMLRIRPPAHIQKPAAASRGNANARAPSCHRNHGNAQADSQWQQRAEHEADTLGVEQLRSGVVVDVGNAGALKTDVTLTTDGPEQADQARAEEHPADLLVVGRREPIGVCRQQLRDDAVALVGRCRGGIGGGSRVVIRNGAHNFRFNGSNRLQVAAHNGPRLLAEGASSEITADS